MSLRRLDTNPQNGDRENGDFLSPAGYDDDASSLNSRSDQESDSDDDELQMRARNSRELRAADRLVFMEDDEVDRLVTDSWKQKQQQRQQQQQDRERRGSGLTLPNPMRLLRRASDSNLSSNNDSTEDVTGGGTSSSQTKRRQRRERRKERKEILTEKAAHGEDGDLMYEMEAGGMKDGSSTGDSSDREDSNELDRRRLGMVASAKSDRRRSWRRWVFFHAMMAVGFAILVLVAWKLSLSKNSAKDRAQLQVLSNGTALFAPTTIIISLDGFRADFLQRDLTPRLNAFVKEGVSPKYMLPSFPSVTFPNHYTIATGLYPESHGVVSNTFWDPDLEDEFHHTVPEQSLDPKWWGGEPFWVTAEKAGVRTAIHMWPGSEAHIQDVEPSFLDKYNGKEKLPNKVSRMLEFLDKPGLEDETAPLDETRPQLIAAYVPNVDSDGHTYGPNSTEIRSTIQEVDTMLDDLFAGLEERNLSSIVNVIVVSDHGMATTDASRLLQFEDLLDTSKIEHNDGWPLYGLRPKNPDHLRELYDGLAARAVEESGFDVYLRDEDMPERYHFANNPRIAPLWVVPRTGWAIVTMDEFDVAEAEGTDEVYHPRGLHGYDHEHPLMRAIFIARGPAFPHPPNSQLDAFQNIEIYNMLCDSVGLTPKPNNGTLRLPLKPSSLHNPEDTLSELPDPDPSDVTASATPSSAEAASAAPTTSTEEAHSSTTTVTKPESTHGNKEGHEGHKGGDDADSDLAASFKEAWDWVSSKAGEVWDKISGSFKSEKGEKGEKESG